MNIGINLGTGSAYINNLDGGIDYTFTFPGLVIGLQYKLNDNIKPMIKVQYASNAGATYICIKYGLSYVF